jgi:hypothetical protein
VEPALRALVRSYEYEDWPRGRIVAQTDLEHYHSELQREKAEIKQLPETERAEVRQILREQGLDPALTETVTAARHIAFGYEHARPTMTSWEVFNEGKGVCRDYAHLAITFCRCMNIPARYCTGYLGDIGVPPPYGPMDFAGWFEAYLGGRWYTFDARNNLPRIGRVLIAQGRDAADVPITHTFGSNTLVSFKVWTDEVS